jgi:hypothetical protein
MIICRNKKKGFGKGLQRLFSKVLSSLNSVVDFLLAWMGWELALSITAANIRSHELSSTDLEKEVGTEAQKLAKYRISRSTEAQHQLCQHQPGPRPLGS